SEFLGGPFSHPVRGIIGLRAHPGNPLSAARLAVLLIAWPRPAGAGHALVPAQIDGQNRLRHRKLLGEGGDSPTLTPTPGMDSSGGAPGPRTGARPRWVRVLIR